MIISFGDALSSNQRVIKTLLAFTIFMFLGTALIAVMSCYVII